MRGRLGNISRGAVLATFAGTLALGLLSFSQAAVTTSLVSKNSAGTPASSASDVDEATALSGDGRLVVFQSSAANLPGGDGVIDQIYVRDMKAGKTRLASKDNGGSPALSTSDDQGISASGRFVTFSGTGSGLPGANGQAQVWVHDRKLKLTILASRGNDGTPANSAARDPALSADGRAVVFQSSASNLPGSGAGPRVYVRDLERKRTILASKENDGDPADGSLYGQSISSNGRRVTFYSSDPDLPGGGTHQYVRDLRRKKTILADRLSNETIANGNSYNGSISGNGRFVVFESTATNLPGAGASINQVYVRDLKLGKTRLAGRNSAGDPQDGYAEFAHLSGSGRYVQFVSSATNLPGAGESHTYVRDMQAGKTRLLSRAANGDPADDQATNASISLNGLWVAFESSADNLGGNTAVQQVFRARLP